MQPYVSSLQPNVSSLQPYVSSLQPYAPRHFSESQLFRLDHYLGKEVTLTLALTLSLILPGQGGRP